MHCPPQNPVIPANRSLHYKRPLSTGPKMLRAPIRSAIFIPAFSQWTCLYQRQWALCSCSPVFSCRSCCRMWRCRSGWRTARLSASGWTSRPSAPTDPRSLETPNAPAFSPNKQYVCVQHGAQRCWLWYEKCSNYKTSSAKNNVAQHRMILIFSHLKRRYFHAIKVHGDQKVTWIYIYIYIYIYI